MHHKPLSPKTKAKLSSAAQAQGLYRASHERDACGIGFVAEVKGRKSHEIITQGLDVLVKLTHRAGCGADGKTGDGAGLLFQIPDDFFRTDLKARGIEFPAPTEYGVGMFFLFPTGGRIAACRLHTCN